MDTNRDLISRLEACEWADDALRAALELKGEAQQALFALARRRRQMHFPDNKAQARSVIEISNVCHQQCRYCAIGRTSQERNYTLDAPTMVKLVDYLYGKGRRTVLLQSGENLDERFIDAVVEAVTDVCRRHGDLRLILCLGDLSEEDYARLRNAGATDYILKFEASRADLFAYCKPKDSLQNRLACIMSLAKVGFRVGSGNIVGLPGQTLDDLVGDLKLAHELPLAMNSTTIFVPAENTEFAAEPPGDPVRTLNMMALLRIMNPHRLMPTTSSLQKMMPDGQYLGLMAGANTVTVHDGTPEELQRFFPIYSAKRVRPQLDHFKDILRRAGMTADHLD
ncbi:MAG: radical SAM protein [Kiritimatiellae bacterium]|nr:radical SAM protein [Kiritimatiellia bacterium]